MPKTNPAATASAISQPRSVKTPNLFGSLSMPLDRTRSTYLNQVSTEVVRRVSVYREALLAERSNVCFDSNSGQIAMSKELSGGGRPRVTARSHVAPG